MEAFYHRFEADNFLNELPLKNFEALFKERNISFKGVNFLTLKTSEKIKVTMDDEELRKVIKTYFYDIFLNGLSDFANAIDFWHKSQFKKIDYVLDEFKDRTCIITIESLHAERFAKFFSFEFYVCVSEDGINSKSYILYFILEIWGLNYEKKH